MYAFDFSRLEVPLWRCTRAYCSAAHMLYDIVLVQDEGLTPPDLIVRRNLVRDIAREACVELNNMIAAAKVLRGIRPQ